MIPNRTISKPALAVIAVAILALNGCSLIGLTIGASIDASNPNSKTVPSWQAITIAPGTRIMVVLKDGTRLSGRYSGLSRIPAEQYAAIYSQAMEQLPEGMLPALGESIDISFFLETAKEPEEELEGTFEGFEHGGILIKPKGQAGQSVVSLSSVMKISGDRGHVMAGDTTRRLILEGKIPVWSALVVEGKAGRTLVAMDWLSQIEIPRKWDGAVAGFLMGAVIDVAVAAVVSSSQLEYGSMNFYSE